MLSVDVSRRCCRSGQQISVKPLPARMCSENRYFWNGQTPANDVAPGARGPVERVEVRPRRGRSAVGHRPINTTGCLCSADSSALTDSAARDPLSLVNRRDEPFCVAGAEGCLDPGPGPPACSATRLAPRSAAGGRSGGRADRFEGERLVAAGAERMPFERSRDPCTPSGTQSAARSRSNDCMRYRC